MNFFSQYIPEYLTTKVNIKRTVFFAAIFAMLFINFYSPFDARSWYGLNRIDLLLLSMLSALTGVMVIVISRIGMFRYSRKRRITYGLYFLWVAAEIFFMAVVYTVFVKFVLNDQREFILLFEVSVKNTALVLLLPYALLWLYFAWQEKNMQLEELTAQEPHGQKKMLVSFYDENGKLRLSLKTADLLYLQAADNYVTIFYNNAGKKGRYMIRNRLKSMENQLQPYNIIRCHRSYMVNFEQVRMLRKEKGELFLSLEAPAGIELPVSRTYAPRVMEAFSYYTSLNS